MANTLPALVAGGYINPGKQAKLVVLRVPGFTDVVKMQSDAFATGTVEARASGAGAERTATATVQITEGIDPDTYEVFADLGHGWRPTWHLLVEPPSDGSAAVTVTKVDDKGLMYLKVEPVSRNLARGLSGNATVGVEAATELAVDGPDGWFGLVYDWSNGSAANNFVRSSTAQPGKTYDVKIKQHFHGGHSEIITGKVTLPAEPPPPPKPGGKPFIIDHKIDLAKLGTKAAVKHTIAFGEAHEQDNTAYGLAILPSVVSVSGSEDDINIDAVQASRELAAAKIKTFTDKITFYSGNPAFLQGNKNYKASYRVTVIPIDEPDEK